jgi:hypothetical protein
MKTGGNAMIDGNMQDITGSYLIHVGNFLGALP